MNIAVYSRNVQLGALLANIHVIKRNLMKRIKLIVVLVCSTVVGFSQSSLVSFEGIVTKEGAIELAWSVNDLQHETSHFEIQRSADGIDWTTEAIIFCDDRAMAVSHKYTRRGVAMENVSYRIREVKVTGQESFSHVEIFSTDSIQGESDNSHALYVVQLKQAKGKVLTKRLTL